jgi:hypothetical protein
MASGSIVEKLIFSTEEYDTNNNYDPTLSRFTPTIAGKYLVTASFYLSATSTSSRSLIAIYKNGSVLKYGDVAYGSGIEDSLRVSAIVDLNGSTDFIEIYGLVNTATKVIAGDAATTYFQASLLSTNVAHSGYLLSPNVAFSAYKSSNQTLASNTSTRVLFNTEEYDTNGNWDAVNSVFTPTAAGRYILQGVISIDGANTIASAWVNVTVRKNGVDYKDGSVQREIITTAQHGVDFNFVVDANGSTDYFEIAVRVNTTAPILLGGSSSTYIQGNLLAATAVYAKNLLTPNVGCSVHRNAVNQIGVVNQVYTKVMFTAEDWDNNACFDVVNSRFQPTTAGRYSISAALGFNVLVTNAYIKIAIYKNGAVFKENVDLQYSTYSRNICISGFVDMNGGTDYVEIFAYQDTTGSQDILGASKTTYFQAQIVYAESSYAPGVIAPNVGFSANKGGTDQTGFGTSTATKITFTTELYDTNSNYDAANSRFQPTVAGRYLLRACVNQSTQINEYQTQLFLYKNGVRAFTGPYTRHSGTWAAGTHVEANVELNGTTDYVEVFFFQDSNKDVSGAITETYFQGQLVQPLVSYQAGALTPNIAFLANRNNVDQTGLVSTTATKLLFNNEVYDTNNNYDPSSGRFTPTVAGRYMFQVMIRPTGAPAVLAAVIQKNGVTISDNAANSSSSSYSSFTSIIVEMNGSTDYVEALCYHNLGSNLTINGSSAYSYFQGYLVSASVAHAGHLLSPNVGFSAHKGETAQTGVLTGTYTKLTFPVEEYDTNGSYDATNSRFQPNVAGRYSVNAAAFITGVSSGASLELCLYKNGSMYKETGHRSQTTSDSTVAAWVVDVNGTTDFIEIYFSQSGGSTATVSGAAASTYFQASLLAATAVYAKNMLTPNVGFSANKGGTDQTGVVGGNGANGVTKITFTNEEFDTNTNYDATTSTFTPKVAGKYQVNISIWTGALGDNEYVYLYLYKNGVTVKTCTKGTNSVGYTTLEISAIIDMNGGTDYLEVFSNKNGASTWSVMGYADGSYFQAQLLSATTAYSGYNMAPSVSFSVVKSVAQSGFNDNALLKVTFDVEEFDTNNNYDATLSRFTPAVPGKYQINAGAGIEVGGSGISICFIYKNGVAYKNGEYRQTTGDYYGCDVSCLVDMNGSTDYLEVYFLQRTGGTKSVTSNAGTTYFQGALVSTSTDIGTLVKENSQLISGNNIIASYRGSDTSTALTLASQIWVDTPVVLAFNAPVSGMYNLRFSAAHVWINGGNNHAWFKALIDGVNVCQTWTGLATASGAATQVYMEQYVYITKGSHTVKIQQYTDTATSYQVYWGYPTLVIENPNNQYNVLQLPDYKNNSRLVKEIILPSASSTIVFDGLDGVADGGYEIELEVNGVIDQTGIGLTINGDTNSANYIGEILLGQGTLQINSGGHTGTGGVTTTPPSPANTICGTSNGNFATSSIDVFILGGRVQFFSRHKGNIYGVERIATTGIRYTPSVSNISTLTIQSYTDGGNTALAGGLGTDTRARLYRKGTTNSEPQKIIYTGVPTAGSLVKEVKLTALTTTVEFTGLNIIQDGGYYLEINAYNGYNGSNGLYCYVNGDMAKANYNLCYISAVHGSASVSSSASDLQMFAILNTLNDDMNLSAHIALSPLGMVSSTGLSARQSSGNTNIEILEYSWRYETTVTNVTSLKFMVDNLGLGIGSTFRLYRKTPQVVYPPSVITTQKVYEKTITLSSAQATVTFDGLDIIADGGYEILYGTQGDGVAGKTVYMFVNGDINLTTNYRSEFSQGYNSSVNASGGGTPEIGYIGATNTLKLWGKLDAVFYNGFFVANGVCGFGDGTYDYSRANSIRYNLLPPNITSFTFQCSTGGFPIGSTFTVRGKKARTDVIQIPSLTNVVDQKVITTATSSISFPNLNILRDGRYRLEAELCNTSGTTATVCVFFNGDYLKTNYNRNYFGSGADGASVGDGVDNNPMEITLTTGYTCKLSGYVDLIGSVAFIRASMYNVDSATLMEAYEQTMKYNVSVSNITQIDLVARDAPTVTNSVSSICSGSKATLYKDVFEVPATSPYDVVSAGKLTDLVKEIILQSPSSQVDFDGLDINRDGEYELRYTIIGGTVEGDYQCQINGSSTANDYDRVYFDTNVALGSSNTAPSVAATANQVPYLGTIGVAREAVGVVSLNMLNGKVIIRGSASRYRTSNSVYCESLVEAIYRPAGGVQNLTKASMFTSTTFAAGSTFRLYRKKANNVLALTSRYLNNLVEEKVLTMDSSSVTFTGLDSLVDGDYVLESNLVANATGLPNLIVLINGDTTTGSAETGYYTFREYSGTNAVPTKDASVDASVIGTLSANMRWNMSTSFKVIDGIVLISTHSMRENTSTDLMQLIVGTRKAATSITQISFRDRVGATGFKAGSKFTLYKSNGAKKLVPYDPTDITTRTGGYPLRPGEVVYLNYNAAAVPLNVATEEGEYEITVICNGTSGGSADGSFSLLPNGTSIAGFICSESPLADTNGLANGNGGNNTMSTNSSTQASLYLAWCKWIYRSSIKVSTITAAKHGEARTTGRLASGLYRTMAITYISTDYSTPWTSLGTLNFPTVQSGKIVIKRVI